MNLRERLSLALKIARGSEIAAAHDPRLTELVRVIADHNTNLWPRLDIFKAQAEEYARSSWVYVAVTRIAEAAALVPFGVHQIEPATGKPVSVPAHPLEKLLRAPNPTMSQFELLEATFGYLELNGNAYWYLAGDADGTPAELWVLRPDRVRIVPDRSRYVGAYVYSLDGLDIPLHPDEVIHFKRWHPKDDYLGLSALEAAALASHTDQAMAAWNFNFFDTGKGVPAGILTIKNMV
ncbi:MAG: phage portal protein, partial [Aggregatilineales bacterium]